VVSFGLYADHIILSTEPGQYQLNTNSTNQRFQITYNDTFSRQPGVALGTKKYINSALQGLECDQTNNLSLAALAVPHSSGTTLPIVVNTPWNKTNWKTLKLNYLASDRDDI